MVSTSENATVGTDDQAPRGGVDRAVDRGANRGIRAGETELACDVAARELQSVKRVAVAVTPMVDSGAADPANRVKQLRDLRGDGAALAEQPQNLREIVWRIDEDSSLRGRALCHRLDELPLLDQRRVGIFEHVALSEHRITHEERVMAREEREIRRFWDPRHSSS